MERCYERGYVSWGFDTEGSAVSDDSPDPTRAAFGADVQGERLDSMVDRNWPGLSRVADEMAQLLAAGYDERALWPTH